MHCFTFLSLWKSLKGVNLTGAILGSGRTVLEPLSLFLMLGADPEVFLWCAPAFYHGAAHPDLSLILTVRKQAQRRAKWHHGFFCMCHWSHPVCTWNTMLRK